MLKIDSKNHQKNHQKYGKLYLMYSKIAWVINSRPAAALYDGLDRMEQSARLFLTDFSHFALCPRPFMMLIVLSCDDL